MVGVATGKAIAQHSDFLRAVLRGRRMAVDYIYAHPDESAAIVAKAYDLDAAVAKAAIHNLIARGNVSKNRSSYGSPRHGPRFPNTVAW